MVFATLRRPCRRVHLLCPLGLLCHHLPRPHPCGQVEGQDICQRHDHRQEEEELQLPRQSNQYVDPLHPRLEAPHLPDNSSHKPAPQDLLVIDGRSAELDQDHPA